MAEPFKNLIGRAQITQLAERLAAAQPGFRTAEFLRRATRGLDALELKARARHVADALEAVLPAEPRAAFAVLTKMMGPPLTATEGYGNTVFTYFPVSEYLERHGARDVEAALGANYELTRRFSSEFCLRPLILADWARTRAALERWVKDPDPHVRRLVSEGTRPRLPWGRQLTNFVADPSPVLPFLEALKDDPSEYVRRSVANNLNDIAKDHPQLVIDLARRWLVGASKERRRLVEHALRTLLKRGDPAALALIGAGDARSIEAKGSVRPSRVKRGEKVVLAATVRNRGKVELHTVVEARVHFPRPSGKRSVKPFRLGRVDLAPGEQVTVSKGLLMKDRTIRALHEGVHEVELQVNGARSPMGRFRLLP